MKPPTENYMQVLYLTFRRRFETQVLVERKPCWNDRKWWNSYALQRGQLSCTSVSGFHGLPDSLCSRKRQDFFPDLKAFPVSLFDRCFPKLLCLETFSCCKLIYSFRSVDIRVQSFCCEQKLGVLATLITNGLNYRRWSHMLKEERVKEKFI